MKESIGLFSDVEMSSWSEDSGPGEQYFHDGDSLFVKLLARGEDWVAGSRLDLTW